MANVNAIRDDNHVPVALGVKSTNTAETTPFTINPVTGRLLVDIAGGGGTGTVTSIAAGTGILATPDPITTTGTIALIASLQPLASLGSAGQLIRVNAGATALEYFTASAGGVASVVGTTNRITVDSTDPANPIVDIAATYVGQTSITTLGTIGTGTWNATAIAVNKIAAITANRAVVSDGSGFISAATTTATEIGYVNGVTSSIQTQLDSKQATGNYITALTGDVTASGPGSVAATLATVNGNVGTFGSATQSVQFTVNGKGLITAAANVTVTPAVGSITGLGTGVATALAINVGSAGAFVTFNGALGTPSSGTVTNLTGTASININGTVGATTPTTATFTTATINTQVTLAENASIALDPAGSADGKYTGITQTGTAGYTQSFGDLVYLDPTDSRWEACDANSASGADGDSRGNIGIVVVAGTDGNACTILRSGIIRADAKFPTFTVNNPIYVSETAGSVTQTQPTTTDVVIRIVGAALTADEMWFNPDNTWITHT